MPHKEWRLIGKNRVPIGLTSTQTNESGWQGMDGNGRKKGGCPNY